MPAGGSYLCFILTSEGLETHLPRACPKEQGSGKCGGNHCKRRAKEGSEDTRASQGEEPPKQLQGLEGTQGAPRKAVAEEAGRVRESRG